MCSWPEPRGVPCRRILAWIVLLGLLSGCSVLGDPSREGGLQEIRPSLRDSALAQISGSDPLLPGTPQQATGSRAAAASASGKGPAASIGKPISSLFSLPQAVAFGLHNSPRLRVAQATITRARGQEEAAFAPFLPQLDVLSQTGTTSRALGPASAGATGIILASPTGTHDFAQAELQVQWILYDFGRTAGRYHQAGARERIAELRSARAGETVAFDVAAAYLQALHAKAIRNIQEAAVPRAEATLKDARSRRAAGVAEKDDVLRADVQLSLSQDAVDVAQEADWAALARLNNAMGRDASLPLQLVDWSSTPSFELSLVRCLEIAIRQRLEIGIAREAVAAAQSGREATAAEFLPRVYALGSIGELTGTNLQRGLQEGAGIHIDIPLFHGGQTKGNLRAAEAEVQEAAANAVAIVDDLTLEVTLAYRSVTTAHRRIGRLRPVIAEARENLRLLRNRYRNGNATPTDIVDAETTLTAAQQRLSSATYAYLSALARLDYALGNPQGWSLAHAGTKPSSASLDGRQRKQ